MCRTDPGTPSRLVPGERPRRLPDKRREARYSYNCDSWRPEILPQFAASHGSARRRETRVTGREPWLTPFRDFAAPQLVAVVGGEVVEPTANAVGFREIARPALVDRFCFVAKQTPSETHAKRREARYFYNRRCKPPDSRPPPQIRGKPRQCAPPRNARAQAARLWLLGNSGRWAR